MAATHPEEIERRRFLRNAATVAWGVPLIMTLGAERAGAQVPTCIKGGHPCVPGGIPCCQPSQTCRPAGNSGFRCVGPPGGK